MVGIKTRTNPMRFNAYSQKLGIKIVSFEIMARLLGIVSTHCHRLKRNGNITNNKILLKSDCLTQMRFVVLLIECNFYGNSIIKNAKYLHILFNYKKHIVKLLYMCYHYIIQL